MCIPSVSVKMACERLECSFMAVDEVTRAMLPASSHPNASSTPHTTSSVTPTTTGVRGEGEVEQSDGDMILHVEYLCVQLRPL